MTNCCAPRAMNVLHLSKTCGQRYVFLFDDESVEAMLRELGKAAGDPELDFTWYDAALLSQRVRRLTRERELE